MKYGHGHYTWSAHMMYLGEEVYRVAPLSVNTSVSPAKMIQARSLTRGTWRIIKNTYNIVMVNVDIYDSSRP